MTAPPGQDPGQAISSGFSWADHVAWLTEEHGSLAAVADRLALLRGDKEDRASIERALRRLRTQGQKEGGTWGQRVLGAFGLPTAVDARARWMGAYHSRFTDLPLGVCQDLVALWDRPPVSDAPKTAVWLALGRATCALRADDFDAAERHFQRARATAAKGPPEARAELFLGEAYVASRRRVNAVSALLEQAASSLKEEMDSDEKACLHVRWIDQRAYHLNRGSSGTPPDRDAAEALFRAVPTEGVPPFVRSRRASGLAYSCWKRGASDEAAAFAREAVEHAGDGGHLRLRAMALHMLSRIVRGPEGEAAEGRARQIVAALEDEGLRMRFERGARREARAPK